MADGSKASVGGSHTSVIPVSTSPPTRRPTLPIIKVTHTPPETFKFSPSSLSPEQVTHGPVEDVIFKPGVHLTSSELDLFDPTAHLSFNSPSEVHTMASLGLVSEVGISPTAVSEPFQLFTREAINRMRDEVLCNPEIRSKCQYSSNLAPNGQLRGYAKDHAPFIYQAWIHPETLAILSAIAGIDLVPACDFEIGHVNISQPASLDANSSDSAPIVDWHFDGYPFVCVLMLSDCNNMIGGETAVLNQGETMKVRGPTQGCAVILQGRYLLHQALNTFGGAERITMVTSLRPRSPFVKDDTTLRTVRGVSHLPTLYAEFSDYRLANLLRQVERKRAEVRAQMQGNGEFDTIAMREFLSAVAGNLERTREELVPDDEVVKGFVPE